MDYRVRLAAFNFLTEQTQLHGEVLPRTLLEQGFVFQGKRVRLAGPQGIFKPAILSDMPLTITTVPAVRDVPRPYDDEVGPDGRIRYRYRGTDPKHPDNLGLRRAMERQAPLIYLYGIVPGRYMPVWPVYIAADDPARLTFSIVVDDAHVAALRGASLTGPAPDADLSSSLRRQYITTNIRQRLHQRRFRERVLQAYREQCAICRLRHAELLEAAHILPDGHPRGEPIISNGVALCKIHHAAFDRNILGIRPDLKVELRPDILQEEDGPMLKWGLQNFQGALLHVPRAKDLRPNQNFLEERYAMFRSA
ncbi:MAG: HNH endonuclease [Elusimicrobia bacterium]|nr:HNH endonuclease [Elusimicrobiota bacterium]